MSKKSLAGLLLVSGGLGLLPDYLIPKRTYGKSGELVLMLVIVLAVLTALVLLNLLNGRLLQLRCNTSLPTTVFLISSAMINKL